MQYGNVVRKLVVEAIGTFFLVLTIGLVVIEPGAGSFAPLAIAAALMVMVYAGGHVSGAHYNPAVTLAVWMRGLATTQEAIRYWFAQLVGALLAAAAVIAFKGGGALVSMEMEPLPAVLAELLFTFALAWVVLNVATARGTQGNSYFGLAIAFTVLAGAYAVGGISGAAFNPAVAVALVVMNVADGASLLLYFPAQLGAAAAAAWLFDALALGIDKPTDATPADQASLTPPASTGSPG